MKYPRPVYGIEAGSGGPAGAPITPVADQGAADGAGQPAAAPADWRTSLPDELRASPALNDIGDVNSLAKQFIDQQQFMGNALRVPGPDAGQEDRNAFHERLLEKVPGLMPRPDPLDVDAMNTVYDAMGRPAGAEHYQRPTAPEGAQPLNEHLDKVYTESAYRNGLTQTQYHNVMADFTAGQADLQAHAQAAKEVENAELRQEWGYTHDNRIAAIQNTLAKFGFSEGVVGAAAAGGLGKQDAQAFYKMVEALGGEAEIGTQPGGAPTGMTPAEAEAQIQEIMAKPEYMHHDMSVRKPWMDKVQSLLKYAAPEAAHGPDAVQQMRRSNG